MSIKGDPAEVRVAIVGAGFAGIGAAIRMTQRGWRDFVILERAADLGGTWRDNAYPGCACDVPSHLYSYSFAPHPGWSRTFSGQPEIWEYLRRCAGRYGIEPHIRFGHEVLAADWDAEAQRWCIRTSAGDYLARVLVAAAGPLSEPVLPRLAGLPSFAGRVFHSAAWDHGYDLTGRRVAVIGTGASAIQFVPEIAPRVSALHVFQRTPPWILPRLDRPISGLERRIYRAFPPAQRAMRAAVYTSRELLFGPGFRHPALMRLVQRAALANLRRQVPDPRLRRRLIPAYTMGCKRVLLSSTYLPALSRDNVELVTDAIQTVTPGGIVTADGVHRDLDAIIFGTGFRATDPPIARRIRGRSGATLAETWQGSPRAYLGVTVVGFPNLFLLLGPNTVLGHTSVLFMIESQLRYLMSALSYLRRPDVAAAGTVAVEPTESAQRRCVDDVDARMRGTVWMAGGCRSWYLDSTGRNSTLWPGPTWSYRRRLREFDPAAYVPAARSVRAVNP